MKIILPKSGKVDHVLHHELTMVSCLSPLSTRVRLSLWHFVEKRSQLRLTLPVEELLGIGIAEEVGQVVVTATRTGHQLGGRT